MQLDGEELVGLRDLHLKRSYDSDSDNILADFYVPALSKSVLYSRLTGFFSSTSLAVAAKGISGLIRNGGHIRLITGARFRRTDIEAIKKAYSEPEKILEEAMLRELNHLEDEFVRDHVRALGWMVAKKNLRIKVAFVLDDDGYPLDSRALEMQGIFHQKVGLIEDAEGDQISFSGSENESASGWQSNIEEFKVFRNWIDAESEYFEADLSRFTRFWQGQGRRTKVIDIPKAIEEKLIEIAPDDIDTLNLDRWTARGKKREKIVLRDYQKEGVDNWILRGKKGIFEMATGTGKTFTALGVLEKIAEEEKKLVVVIACPYNHLIDQWTREIGKFGINLDLLRADSTNLRWKDELTDYLLDIKNGISEKLIVLTTHATFSTSNFIDIIKETEIKRLLIVDEVHGVGAPRRKEGLIEEYNLRLGLSATPRRYFDDEGTEKLYEYFGDVVFEFGLEKAITNGYLLPYEYSPYFIELTKEEREQYEEATRRIAKSYFASRNNEEKEELYKLLCIERQNIVKNAVNKYRVLRQILLELKEIKHCLIYCTPQQIDRVQDILNSSGIIQHRFTQKEGIKEEKKYSGLSERGFLLKKFAEGTYQALVAMKVLDEGVDIPPARMAIILANSGNPREYVQRRGRVLRHSPGKSKARIFDLIVVPGLTGQLRLEHMEMEKRIVIKELKRYKDFASTSINPVDCVEKIEEIEEKYGISL